MRKETGSSENMNIRYWLNILIQHAVKGTGRGGLQSKSRPKTKLTSKTATAVDVDADAFSRETSDDITANHETMATMAAMMTTMAMMTIAGGGKSGGGI
jgi:hypothetical protein